MPASEPLRCGFCGSEYTVEGETTQYPVPTAEARLRKLAVAVQHMRYVQSDGFCSLDDVWSAEKAVDHLVKAEMQERTIRTFVDNAATLGTDLP